MHGSSWCESPVIRERHALKQRLVGAPAESLELRLERNKCISNLRFNFLDRLYDRRLSIGESYAAGHVNLHLHGRLTGDGMWCFTFVAPTATEVFLKTGMDVESGVPHQSERNACVCQDWSNHGADVSNYIHCTAAAARLLRHERG